MKWTEDEIVVLNNYENKKDLLRLLNNRSWNSIRKKRRMLFPNKVKKCLKWTEEEINILIKNYENAVKEDLKFMLEFAEISVIVRLIGLDVIEINITIVQPENGVERKYIYLWDGLQLVDNSGTGGQNAPNLEGLQQVLQINL